MDLIYTNARCIDQGVLLTYGFDLSFGAEENDFELTVAKEDGKLEFGAFVYIEGTEYGGIIDGIKTATTNDTITHYGRTFHGILNSKVIEPDSGEDHFVVSGDANDILSIVIARLTLSDLFTVDLEPSGINISSYQFNRYCKAYDGLCAMLKTNGAKLKISWVDRQVHLCAEPIVDYTHDPVDGDTAALAVEQYDKKVNHLICLGGGELVDRAVVHLYVDQFGNIGDTQYYTGLLEITDVYENNGIMELETLRKEAITKLETLRNIDKVEIAVLDTNTTVYDIGDIVGGMDVVSGISATSAVSQKIVKINNGVTTIEYKTGSK